MYIKNSKGERSGTWSILWIGFVVGMVKLLLSDLEIHGMKFPPVSPVEIGGMVVALSSIKPIGLMLKGKNETNDPQV